MRYASLIYFINFLILIQCFSAEYAAYYFTENQVANVLNVLTEAYGNNLQPANLELAKESINYNYFFHSDDKIIPSIVASGKQVNFYFYKNNNKGIDSIENLENLASFDVIFTETKDDLKQFLQHANQGLVQLAKESKYVPLIRILGPSNSYERRNKITGLVDRIRDEIPFKKYIQEALPIFKTESIQKMWLLSLNQLFILHLNL